MNKTAIIILVVLVLFGGGLFFFQKKDTSKVQKQEQVAVGDAPTTSQSGYKGAVIAGASDPYLEFNQEDFEKAQRDGKIVFLDFYANWCPICRAEAPTIEAGFNGLRDGKVVGFRVNYKDDQTDESETELAKTYQIPYQHTKVILKDKKEILRSGDSWDMETFTKEIYKVTK